MRIGVVAPSTPITEEVAERVRTLAAAEFPDVELVFHPQCFVRHNHFAGPDEERAAAFVEMANDAAYDALWFARGGYGSCRIAELVVGQLAGAAHDKAYVGYSDAGYLLAGLYARGIGRPIHAPMPMDIRRERGPDAVRRTLSWLTGRDAGGLEGSLTAGERVVAFNITVFSQLLGTPLQPDLCGHTLLIEDVSEFMYRTDRSMFHITSNLGVRQAAGIRLGRCTEVPENDPDFGETEEEVVRHWCKRSGIPFLGRCDIGHDADNKIVPFGTI
jgi:muramoyltetrapeptide carboxypeptidase